MVSWICTAAAHPYNTEQCSVGALRKRWATTDLNLSEITMPISEAIDPDEFLFCLYNDDKVTGLHIVRNGVVVHHQCLLVNKPKRPPIPAKVGDKIIFYYQHWCESSRCYFWSTAPGHHGVNLVCLTVVEDPSS